MADAKLRRAIAFEAARLMYGRSESEYYTAKRKAAKLVCRGNVKPSDLPSNAEIRDLIQTFARTHEGDALTDRQPARQPGFAQVIETGARVTSARGSFANGVLGDVIR